MEIDSKNRGRDGNYTYDGDHFSMYTTVTPETKAILHQLHLNKFF